MGNSRIKLKIKMGFFAVLMLIALAVSAPHYFPALLCSVAIHESGHVIMARICKVPMCELKLGIFGASLYLSSNTFSYGSEILICLGGPLCNFLSVAVFYCVTGYVGTSLFCMSSLALGTLNLLPVYSFDGGRIFSAILHMIFSVQICEAITKVVSFIIIFTLWCISVYLLLRVGASLTLFVFSVSMFAKIFVPDAL